jgi:hypothetical protein
VELTLAEFAMKKASNSDFHHPRTPSGPERR